METNRAQLGAEPLECHSLRNPRHDNATFRRTLPFSPLADTNFVSLANHSRRHRGTPCLIPAARVAEGVCRGLSESFPHL
jgi:hypothetical protein